MSTIVPDFVLNPYSGVIGAATALSVVLYYQRIFAKGMPDGPRPNRKSFFIFII